jgi:type I restriction enzyme S subunit
MKEARSRKFRPYPKYKDSGVDWLGRVPDHWLLDRFKSTVLFCQNGLWGDDPDNIRDIICVRVADFDRVALRVNIYEPTLRAIDERALAGRLLRKGDLLLEKSGGGEGQPVGTVVLYDHSEPAICSNFIARMPVRDDALARFLSYLHSAAYAARLNNRSIKQNTGIQNLDSSSYLGEKVALPPLHEQRVIADFLDRNISRIDELIEKKGHLVKLLQEKRTAFIAQAVTKGLAPGVPVKHSGVEWLGEVPAHWAKYRMAYLAKMISGGTPSKENQEYWHGKIPWVSPKDMKSRIILDAIDHISESAVSDAGLVLVESPAVLIVVRGMILARKFPVALAAVPVTINQDMKALRLSEGIDAKFFVYFLEGISELVLSLVEESGHGTKRLRTDLWRALDLCLPPMQEQRKIAAFLDRDIAHLDRLIDRIYLAIDRLKDLRIALVSAATTGKVDVREEKL